MPNGKIGGDSDRGLASGGDEAHLSPFTTSKPIPETVVRRDVLGYMRADGAQLVQGLLQLGDTQLTLPTTEPPDATFLAHVSDGDCAWLDPSVALEPLFNNISFSDTGFGEPILGIAARAQLPSSLAYEDETNVFTAAVNRFDGILLNTIDEVVVDAGVVIEGVPLKDGRTQCSYIELRSDNLQSGVFHQLTQGVDEQFSAGHDDDGALSDGGGLTIDIEEGSGWFTNQVATPNDLYYVEWAEEIGFVVPDNQQSYIGVAWAGPGNAPTFTIKTAREYNFLTEWPLGTVGTQAGAVVNVQSVPFKIRQGVNSLVRRLYETAFFARANQTGLIVDETDDTVDYRYITMSDGIVWLGTVRSPVAAVDTLSGAAIDFVYQYNDTNRVVVPNQRVWATDSNFVDPVQDQWLWNDTADVVDPLQQIPNNRYGVFWFALSTAGALAGIYHDDYYTTLSQAEEALPPTWLADVAQQLIAKVVFQQGDDSGVFFSLWGTDGAAGSGTLVTKHGNLAGLTDDDHPGHPWLTGRVGGQAQYGGTTTGEDYFVRANLLNDGTVFLQDLGGDVVVGTDPGGAQLLRVGGDVVMSALTATTGLFSGDALIERSDITEETGVRVIISNTASLTHSFAGLWVEADNYGHTGYFRIDGLGTGPMGTPGLCIGTPYNDILGFCTNDVERARFVGLSGELLIGTTTQRGDFRVQLHHNTVDTLLRLSSEKNASSVVVGPSIYHGRGVGNVTDADNVVYAQVFTDSGTTEDAIHTRILHQVEDVTHASRTAGIAIYTMLNGSLAEAARFRGNKSLALQGTLEVPDVLFTGGVGSNIQMGSTNQRLSIASGNATNSGANIVLYGAFHATMPGTIRIRDSNTDVLLWNGTSWSFQGTNVAMGALSATGNVTAANGNAAAPGYNFAGQTSTGMYLVAPGLLAWSVAGSLSVLVNSGAEFLVTDLVRASAGLETDTISEYTTDADITFNHDVVMLGALTATGPITVGESTPGDNFPLLKFQTSRSWQFETDGADGASQSLMLRDLSGSKVFKIGAEDGAEKFSFLLQVATKSKLTLTDAELVIDVSGENDLRFPVNASATFTGVDGINATAGILKLGSDSSSDAVGTWYRKATADWYAGLDSNNKWVVANEANTPFLSISAGGVTTFNALVSSAYVTIGTTGSADLNMLRAGANYITASNASGQLLFRTGGANTRLQITAAGAATFTGALTANELTIDSFFMNGTAIVAIANDTRLYYSGGNLTNSGANLTLWGGSYPDAADDFRFRASNTNVLYWDNSASLLTLTGALTATGTVLLPTNNQKIVFVGDATNYFLQMNTAISTFLIDMWYGVTIERGSGTGSSLTVQGGSNEIKLRSVAFDDGLSFQVNSSIEASSRLFHREASTNLYGFSWIYAGASNPTLGGTAFTLTANTYNLIRHGNSAAGALVLSISRDTGTATFDGKLVTAGEIEINGALNHDGSTAGFYGAAPVSQAAHITAPLGGTVIDVQARQKVVSLILLVENLGLTALS